LIGQTISHYRIVEKLGGGGMGVVYLGVSWDGAPVAVKVLRPELAGDEEFRRRFGREVAALTLDDIDWRRERLAIPERKAGHSTAFPLSGAVGQALADYFQHGRPDSAGRHVFFRAMAPVRPIGTDAVSSCARRYLLRAGIEVPRPGSHTLRHSAVQRLADAGFSLKTIGDFAGHRSAASTEIYAKVDVESLREVALGDGEQVLR